MRFPSFPYFGDRSDIIGLRIEGENPTMSHYFPPTPAPSLPSPSLTGDHSGDQVAMIDQKSYPHYTKPTTAPPMVPLPLTPPEEKLAELRRLQIDEEAISQRTRRGRAPMIPSRSAASLESSSELEGEERLGQSSKQRLDVDLDAYSGEFDESREPTLSYHTTSTADSIAGTPSSTHHAYGTGPNGVRDKTGQEPRVRVRSINGRATAYSSAESSGAYSYHQYENQVFHPHPPPLPTRPQLPISPTGADYQASEGSNEEGYEAEEEVSITQSQTSSFSYRPWESEEVNRFRSHSNASISSNASRSSRPASSSLQHHDYHYPDSLPWDTQRALENQAQAVTMVEEGREKTLDMAKVREIGGIAALTEQKITALTGITHLLLSGCGSELVDILPALLRVLAPTLVVLDISHNSFTDLPLELKQCLSLEELNISSNPIRGVVPHFIGALFSLRQLQMDNCTIHTLPADLQDLANLHTLCLRRNRLVSLPSWLCHLSQLEILKVDDNPFCREWQSIVAPILMNQDTDKPSTPYIPARAPSHSGQGMRAAQSASSLASSVCSTPSAREMISSPSIESIMTNSPISATPSLTQLAQLGPIMEDGPQSAPLRAPSPYTPTTGSQPEMRRMRSAGLLHNMYAEDNDVTPTPPLRTVRAESEYLPMPTASASRLANIALSNSSSRIPSPMEENRSIGMTASTSKTGGKWGFLRKMSMNRLKPADKAALLQTSASSNLKLMPPALTHANTEPLQPPGRPMLRSAASSMTLPGPRVQPIAEANEFGQSSGPSTPSTLPGNGLPSSLSMWNGFGRSNKGPTRGKRRSFLPIDTPPSISLTLPSTMPPMFENGFEFPPTPPRNGPTTIFSRPESSARSHSTTPSVSNMTCQSHDYEHDVRYVTGLVSIKSYLRDLYDLSRPSIEPVGSFEVIGTGEPGGPTSPNPNPSIGVERNSIAEARRVGLNLDRRPSVGSDGTGTSGCDSLSGKKFKNDKCKRAKILREIYETERTYVRGLGELVSIYVKPSGQPLNPGKPGSETIIPASERKIVFGGIESIMTIHRDNLLPALERAIRDLIDNGDDDDGLKSQATAHAVGEVFRTYIAYMKQYSTYINNFDNAQSRMRHWMASSTWIATNAPSPAIAASKSVAAGASIASTAAGIGAGVVKPMAMSEAVPHTGSQLTTAQRKRTKAFLKKCRTHPMHSQINLESYLLLPIQRVPRYKLLLEDLSMCTPPRETGPKDKDTLDDALSEISGLASLMNEEKREADSRLRLYHWQQRITGRGPSPLVQPHRKLILDGKLTLIRLVKKASAYVEVDRSEIKDGDSTITPHKIVVPVDHIAPEPMDRMMVMILCSDMMVLGQPRNEDPDCLIDLYNVLRMTSVKEAASIVNGNIIRLVDHKSIYYFNAVTDAEALKWCRAINNARKR